MAQPTRCPSCGEDVAIGRFCGRCGAYQSAPPAGDDAPARGAATRGTRSPGAGPAASGPGASAPPGSHPPGSRSPANGPPGRNDARHTDRPTTPQAPPRRRGPAIALLAAAGIAAVVGTGLWLAGWDDPADDEVTLPGDQEGSGATAGTPSVEAEAGDASLTCADDRACVRWHLPLDGEDLVAARATDQDTVAVATVARGSDTATVRAVDAAGEVVWHTQASLGGAAPDPPGMDVAGDLVVLSGPSSLVALETTTGEVRWESDEHVPDTASLVETAIVDDVLVTMFFVPPQDEHQAAGFHLQAREPDGSLRWSHTADTALIEDDTVVLVRGTEVVRLDARGQERWSTTPDWSAVVDPDDPDEVDARLGHIQLERTADGAVVVAADFQNPEARRVAVLDDADGAPLADLSGGLLATPEQGPAVVLLGDGDDGPVIGYREDGAVLWAHTLTVDGECCAVAVPGLIPTPGLVQAAPERLLLLHEQEEAEDGVVQILDPVDGSVARQLDVGPVLSRLEDGGASGDPDTDGTDADDGPASDDAAPDTGRRAAEFWTATLWGSRTLVLRTDRPEATSSLVAVDVDDGAVRWWARGGHGLPSPHGGDDHTLVQIPDGLISVDTHPDPDP